MKSLFILFLSVLPCSTSLLDLNYSGTATSEVTAAPTFADPTGQIVFAGCPVDMSLGYYKVYVYPVSGTPPALLYRFEDGVLVGTVAYSGGNYYSAVNFTATNVRFSPSPTGVPVYAAATVASLNVPCL